MTLAYEAEPLVFWQQAVDLYRAEAAHIEDAHEAASLLVEAGEVLAERLGRVDDAYAAFDAAQARAPDSVAPLLARARLAGSEADWTEATECLRAALGRMVGARRVPVLSTLSEICARYLGRPDEAVRLLQEAVSLAPDQRDLLIRLETARPATEIAARREVLERRLAVTTSLAERGERLAELGGLLEANAPAKAARTFADAYAANPNWAPAVHGLIRTYVDLKRWDALGRALRTHAERITEDAVRAEVYSVCGVLADAHGDNSAGAVADLENAGSVPGVAEDLVLARDRAGLTTDDWWAQSVDPNQAERRQYHLAAVGRGRLDGVLGAIVQRRRALHGGDDDAIGEAHAALTRFALTDDDARVFHLAEGDEALWSTAPHEARNGYMSAAARQTDAARLPEGLIGLRAVVRTTEDLDAWRRQVDAALTRTADEDVIAAVQLWRATNDPAPTDADTWLALAQARPGHFGAVDAALEGTASGVDLSALVDAAVDAAQSPTRRIRLLLTGAERRAARNDLEGACDRWRAVLAIDPLEVTARNALGRTLYHRAHHAGLKKLIETELAALPTGDGRQQDAWLRSVRLQTSQGETRAALDLLAARPNPSWSTRIEVRRLADALGDELALKALLDQPAASPVEVRTDTLERAGVLLDLGETDAAIGAIDAVLADAPADVLGAWVRAQLALARGDVAHALRLTQHQLATARTPGLARINAHRLTAQLPLAEGRALMAERAAEDADAAWYMLCDAAAAGDASGVVQRLEQLAALVGDRTAQALLLEAGERAEVLGMAPEDRLAIWSRIVEEAPGRATQMLLGLYAEADDVSAQVATLTELSNQADGPAQAAVALWRAGLLLEDTFPQEASRLYWQAIEAWPDDPVALLLALRVGDGGAPLEGADRAQQLEAIAARLAHDGRAARLLASAATTLEGLGADADARRAWLHAAMRYPEQDALAKRALGLLSDADEARIALLEARVRRTTTPAAKAQARHQLAREYIDTRGDRAAAAAVFAQIVAATPGDLAARQEYASLLVGLDRHADAVAQYRIAAQTSAEPTARVALYTRIGELLARHLDDLDGAIQALRQAIGLVDPSGRAQEVLAEVYLRAGEGHRALLAYQRLERMVSDAGRRTHARAGQVRALMSDGREDDARARLLGFLKADPFDPLLGTLARSLDVAVPKPDEVEAIEAPATNGIDLAELDRLQAALDRTQSQQAQADDAVAEASAEAAAMLDLQAFDALEAALAQVAASRGASAAPPEAAPEIPETPAPPEAAPVAAFGTDTEPVITAEDLDLEDAASADAWAVLAEDAVAEDAAAEDAAAEDAVAEDAVAEDAAAEDAAAEDAVAEDAVAEDAVAEDAVAEDAAAEDAAAEDAVAEDAVAEDAAAEDAAAEDAAAEDAAAEDADVADAAAEDAVAEDAVAEDAVAEDAVAEDAAAEDAAAEDAAAEDAAAEDADVADAGAPIFGSLEAPEGGTAPVVEAVEASPTLSAPPAPFADSTAELTTVDAEAIERSLDQADVVPVVPDAVEAVAQLPRPFDLTEAPAPASTDGFVVELDAALEASEVAVELEALELVDDGANDARIAPPPLGADDGADDFDDFDDFDELSSVELEAWEIEEIEEIDEPVLRAGPPPMPPARPPAPPVITKSTDAMAALRDVRTTLGVPTVQRPEPPPPPPEPKMGDSLSNLLARVEAVVAADAPESAISDAFLEPSAAPYPPSAPPATVWPDGVGAVEAERHEPIDAEAVDGEAESQAVEPSDADAVDDRADGEAEIQAAQPSDADAVDVGAAETQAAEPIDADAVEAEAMVAEAAETSVAEEAATEAGPVAPAAERAQPFGVEQDRALDADDEPTIEAEIDEGAALAPAADATAAADGVGTLADASATDDGFFDEDVLTDAEVRAEGVAGDAETVSIDAPSDLPERLDQAASVEPAAAVSEPDEPAAAVSEPDEPAATPLAHVAPVESIDYAALPEGFFSAALDAQSDAAQADGGPDASAESAESISAARPDTEQAAAPRIPPASTEPPPTAPPEAAPPTSIEDEPVTVEMAPDDARAASPNLDSLDQFETREMEALRISGSSREPSSAPIAWLPSPDSTPPNPFSNLPATIVRPAEMALFEGEPTVVRFDEIESASRAPERASSAPPQGVVDAAPTSPPERATPAPAQPSGADAPSAAPAATRKPDLADLADALAARAPVPTSERVAALDAPDDDEDDFFGDAPDLLDSLIDVPPERPSASITRVRRARTTTGPSGSLSGYSRDTSAPPAALSVDRVIDAATLAAAIARSDPDDPSRSSQALAAVALRRKSGGRQMDPIAARARIAVNPVDVDAWASLRIATSRGGAARWIADMRAWLDGRMHTGSVVGVPSRLPDALREGLRPKSAPLALIRMLRALRTRVPLGLAQAQRPDSLYSPEPHEPLTEVADRVAVALGCPMHDLMLDGAQPYAVHVLADAVPVVCVGDALLSRVPEPGRSFLVGQGLAVLAEGTLPAELLDDAAFLGFLAALFDLIGLGGTIAADPAMTAAATEWLQPVIDPHDATLKSLGLQVLASFEDVPAIEARRGLKVYARRLALAVADGLGGALEVMRLLDLDERPLEGLDEAARQAFFEGNPSARDLVECAASGPCLAVRDWLIKNR